MWFGQKSDLECTKYSTFQKKFMGEPLTSFQCMTTTTPPPALYQSPLPCIYTSLQESHANGIAVFLQATFCKGLSALFPTDKAGEDA